MAVESSRQTSTPTVKAGSIWSAQAAAFERCDLGGDRLPGDRLAAAQLLDPRGGYDDYPEPAAADIAAVDEDVDSSSSRTAVTGPRDARCQRRSQAGAYSREPLRGNQYLGGGEDARHCQHGHVWRTMTTTGPQRWAHIPFFCAA